jgi:hypothetical protein
MADLLEPEFADAYAGWKAEPGPAANAAMLKTLTPTIEGAVRTHVGQTNPLILSRARAMALQGLRAYDPAKGKLKTHLYSHLQGLKRVNRQQTMILKAPERVVFDRHHLAAAEDELAHVLGRDPTDDELADHTGFSPRRMARARSYTPGVAEGQTEAAGAVYGGVGRSAPTASAPWTQVVYDGLDLHHKRVMELALGLHGRRPHSNQEIAAKMSRSPGAISQATSRIQALLDEGHDLDPFGG